MVRDFVSPVSPFRIFSVIIGFLFFFYLFDIFLGTGTNFTGLAFESFNLFFIGGMFSVLFLVIICVNYIFNNFIKKN